MRIDRCVCAGVTFQRLHDDEDITMSKAMKLYGCAVKCGMCKPYIEVMLRTGQTVFSKPISSNNDDNIQKSQI